MKRILLAASFAILSCATVHAQNTSVVTTTNQHKTDIKNEFKININDFKTLMSHNDVENARKAYYKLAGLMQTSISAHNQEVEKLSGNAKSNLSLTINQQNDLYREMKMMSVELLKNKDAFFEKLAAFQNTL